MSEGSVQPPEGAPVPESHTAETYHVPKAFFEYVGRGHGAYRITDWTLGSTRRSRTCMT